MCGFSVSGMATLGDLHEARTRETDIVGPAYASLTTTSNEIRTDI